MKKYIFAATAAIVFGFQVANAQTGFGQAPEGSRVELNERDINQGAAALELSSKSMESHSEWLTLPDGKSYLLSNKPKTGLFIEAGGGVSSYRNHISPDFYGEFGYRGSKWQVCGRIGYRLNHAYNNESDLAGKKYGQGMVSAHLNYRVFGSSPKNGYRNMFNLWVGPYVQLANCRDYNILGETVQTDVVGNTITETTTINDSYVKGYHLGGGLELRGEINLGARSNWYLDIRAYGGVGSEFQLNGTSSGSKVVGNYGIQIGIKKVLKTRKYTSLGKKYRQAQRGY